MKLHAIELDHLIYLPKPRRLRYSSLTLKRVSGKFAASELDKDCMSLHAVNNICRARS